MKKLTHDEFVEKLKETRSDIDVISRYDGARKKYWLNV